MRLSSTNFTWSILEYLDPFALKMNHNSDVNFVNNYFSDELLYRNN